MKKLVPVIVIFFISWNGLSQPVQPYYLFFNIDSTADLTNDSVRIWFQAGTNMKLTPGMRGLVFGVRNSLDKNHNQKLGEVIISGKQGYTLTADTKPISTTVSNGYVSAEDVVEFQVDLPVLPYHGLFFNLSRVLIDFTNMYSESFYTLENLSIQDSQEIEQQILDSITLDIRYIGIELNDPNDDIEIESGMFTGNSMYTKMMSANQDDVRQFLNFVWEYRRTYWGKSWIIAEAYASWLINNCPLTDEDMLKYLETAASHDDFLSRARKYDLQNDPDRILYWVSDAENLSNRGDHQQAKEILKVCEKMNNLIKDPYISSWTLFTHGNIAQNEKNCNEAITYFSKAKDYFEALEDMKGVSYCENNIGKGYLNCDQYDSAQERLDIALEIKTSLFEENEDLDWINSICITIGLLHDLAIEINDYEKAITFIEQEKYYRDISNNREAIRDLDLKKSYHLAHLGQFEQTVKVYQEIFPGESPCRKANLSVENALACEEEVLRVAKQAQNPILVAYSYENLAELSKERGDVRNSIAYYEQAIKTLKPTDHIDATLQLMTDLSMIYPIPEYVVEKGQTLSEIMDFCAINWNTDSPEYAIALAEWGIYNHVYVRKTSTTIPILEEAKEKMEKLDLVDRSQYSFVLAYLASGYRYIGKLMEADQCYQEYLDHLITTYGKVSTKYAEGLQHYTSYLISIREMDKAKEYLSEADTIFHHLECISDSRYAYFLGGVSTYFYTLGNDSIGEVYFNRSINLIEEIYGKSSKDYSGMMLGRIIHLLNSNELDEAESLAKNILHTNQEQYRQGKVDRIDIGAYHFFLNLVLIDKEDYKEALKHGKKALKIFKEEEGVNAFYYNNSLYDVLKSYEKTGKTRKAYHLYRDMLAFTQEKITQAFSYLSEEERNSFYALKSYEFNDFGVFAINHHKKIPVISEDLFNMQLYSKGLLLRSTTRLLNAIQKSKDSTALELYYSFKNVKEILANAYAVPEKKLIEQNINLDSLEDAAGSLERQLNARTATFNLSIEERIPDWKEVQAKLNADDCLVEIMRISTSKDSVVYYAALIITEKSRKPELLFLKDGYHMENKHLKSYRNQLMYKIEDQSSYAVFFEPIWDRIEQTLPDVKQIFISPDGVYNQINLQTLYNPGTGKYLIEQFNLHYLTNSGDLLSIKSRKDDYSRRSILFGYPNYNLSDDPDSKAKELTFFDQERNLNQTMEISDLPGTRDEINSIQDFFSRYNWQTTAYLQDEASEENLKNISSPEVLHIATHGYFLEDIPRQPNTRIAGVEAEKLHENPLLRSGLLLSGSENSLKKYAVEDAIIMQDIDVNREDGIFTAYEASNLNLANTEMVVLSACETGLGEIQAGQGVFGLQRAFQVAGAQNVIMSLWTVNDETTRMLMTEFYSNWLETGNKKAAFLQAQFSVKQEYSEPYFWGAFVMIGN